MKAIVNTLSNYAYKDFPIKSSYLEQITWLSTRIKKPRDILLARLVLNRTELERILVEEDATSSGVQLTSKLLREKEVAVFSNLLGQIYTDLYSSIIKNIMKICWQQKNLRRKS
jgi:hypothetical protein